jgi:hypothetical protein
MSFETPAVSASRRAPVRAADRVWDFVALGLLVAGVLLFAVGRASLGSLAAETYDAPVGVSWLSRAEHHDAQTRWGGWLIGAGLLVGTAAAGRHALARRRVIR